MSAWLIIAVIGLGTYALRVSMFIVLGGRELPTWVHGPMTLVGPAAIAALVGSMLLTSHGRIDIGSIPTIAATVAAFVCVRRTGNVMHAFVVGLPMMWIFSLLGL